jgi:hypothetical protein
MQPQRIMREGGKSTNRIKSIQIYIIVVFWLRTTHAPCFTGFADGWKVKERKMPNVQLSMIAGIFDTLHPEVRGAACRCLGPAPVGISVTPRMRVRMVNNYCDLFDNYLSEPERKFKMPKKEIGEFKGWINVPMTDASKERVLSMVDSVTYQEFMEWVASMIYRGFKFNFAWDAYTKAYQVSTFCWGDEHPSKGYATSSRHTDLFVACLSQWHKITDVLGEDEAWNTLPTAPQGDVWD